MARLLLVAVVIGLLLWAVRRMLLPRGRGRRGPRSGGRLRVGRLGPPERLVCGERGAEFDAEQHAWICPHCRR